MPRFNGVPVESEKASPRFAGEPVRADQPQTLGEQLERDNVNPLTIMQSVVEPAATVISGGIADVLGGMTGMGTALTHADENGNPDMTLADERRRFVQEGLTYLPRSEAGRESLERLGNSAPVQWVGDVAERVTQASGDAGYDLTGHPAGGAVGAMLPTAATELSLLKIPKLAGKVTQRVARSAENAADAQRADLQALESQQPSERGVKIAGEAIDTQRPAEVQAVAQFDPRIVRAAMEEGFTEIPPSVAAGNRQFRDIAQGLASIAGSEAKSQYGRFVEALADRADQIIREGGGDLDKAAVSARYKEEALRIIDEIDAQEAVLHNNVRDTIGSGTPVNPASLRQFVVEQAREFGGLSSLPPEMKRIARLVLQPEDGKIVPRNPTYAEFDYIRRAIGQAKSKKTGTFADAESGQLSRIYAAMKQSQKEVAEQHGVRDVLEAADALTIKRKAAEDTMTDLLGRNLSKDLMPQLAAKITGLPKGNTTKFREFVEGIPEGMRQEVVVSALNDLMRGTGADQKGMGAARFVGFMEDLKRSPAAKRELYRYLPESTQKSLDNLQILAEGVYKANKENITTGKIKQFMPEAQGFVRKLMGRGAGAAVDLTTGVPGGGVVGGAAADAVAEFLSNNTSRAQRANEFLAGPSVQELIRRAVRDGVVDGNAITERTRRLEKVVQKSERYQRWAETLEGSAKAELAALGLAGFLLYPAGSEAPQPEVVSTEPQPETVASR